jgi:solute carrier family 35 protein E1
MSNFKSGVAVVFLFAVWSFFSSLTDGIALTILTVWNYPITLLLVTFLVSTAVLFVAFHVFRLAEYQDARALVGVAPALPIAAAQSLGFLLTYMSYSRVSLSFAQTLKSTDPLVNLVFSVLFFGQSFPLGIYLAILPIVAGVALTSSSDASFDAAGFALALTSTACFVLRSLIAKNTLTPLTSTNCYYFLSWLGALVTLPAWLLLEAPPLFGYASPLVSPALFGSVAPAFWAAAPPLAATAASPLAVTPAVALLSPPFLFKLLAVAGGHLTYNLVSYSVLMRVPALTHSVCNVTRRIGVIASRYAPAARRSFF